MNCASQNYSLVSIQLQRITDGFYIHPIATLAEFLTDCCGDFHRGAGIGGISHHEAVISRIFRTKVVFVCFHFTSIHFERLGSQAVETETCQG